MSRSDLSYPGEFLVESYQKGALRIIYGDQIKGMPYHNTLFFWLI